MLALVLIAAPMLRAIAARSRPGDWPETAWWSLLALAVLAVLAAAPSFYEHYTGFAAPALCLLAGHGFGRLVGVAGQRGRRLIAGVAVAVSALLAVASVRAFGAGAVQPDDLAELVAGHRCVWADPAVLIEADIAGDQARRGCPIFVDRYAAGISEVAVKDIHLDAALPEAPKYQAAIAEQFRGSDAVLINDRQLATLAPETVAVLDAQFERKAG